MKRIYSLVLVGVLALILTACPYGSEMSLPYEAAKPIDSRIVGKWYAHSGEKTEIDIRFLGKNKYSITHFVLKSDTAAVITELEGYLCSIGAGQVMDVQVKQKNDTTSSLSSKHYFFKFNVSSKLLKVAFASNHFFDKKLSTPVEVKEYLEKNNNKKGLWSNELTYRKE